MLEFHYLFNRKIFSKKAKEIASEIHLILLSEGVTVISSEKAAIPFEYRNELPSDIFKQLNDLFHTIRSTNLSHHDILKKYLPETRKEPDDQYLFADFFSGVGGLSQGLMNAGFSPAFVNDHYTAALETYYFNHTLPLGRFYAGDIQNLVESPEQYVPLFKDIKLVAGAPPCQSFSTANRWQSLADDPRNVLYKHFLKMLNIIQPEWFIMENVIGIKRIEKEIESDILNYTHADYKFVAMTLNAKDFGIPQNRKRYFLIGSRTKTQKELDKVKLNLKMSMFGSEKFVLKDALFGLPELKTNPIKNKTDYESEENGYKIRVNEVKDNDFLKWINNKTDSQFLLNHKSRFNNDNDIIIFGLLKEGEDSTAPSIEPYNLYKSRNTIFKDKYYKLRQEALCKTITSHMKHDCHMYIHPTQARGLSPREAARIQTFPDDYFFRGSINDWYKQKSHSYTEGWLL
jgi:DNA (cytosine-5)-methyltransferase 1